MIMKNRVLIFLIAVIILAVGALGYYTYFMYDKEEEIKNTEEFPYSELNYEYLLKGESKEIKDLTAYDLVLSTILDVSSKTYNISTVEKSSVDSKNDSYPNYENEVEKRVCSDTELWDADTIGDLKIVWQKLGFTVEEIENMDSSLWPCSLTVNGGVDNYTVVDGEKLKNEIINMFGVDNGIFDDSFVFYSSYKYEYKSGVNRYIYDKNIDKLFFFSESGTTAGINNKSYVVSEYEDGDLYKLEIVDVHFNNYVIADSPINVEVYSHIDYIKDYETAPGITLTINSANEEYKIEDEIIKNKDKFDNYILTYKKTGDNYQFVTIEYIK